MSSSSLAPQMRRLRVYDIGCTSGHDSLIRFWIPDDFTGQDLDHIEAMWNLCMRQFRRSLATRQPAEREVGEVQNEQAVSG